MQARLFGNMVRRMTHRRWERPSRAHTQLYNFANAYNFAKQLKILLSDVPLGSRLTSGAYFRKTFNRKGREEISWLVFAGMSLRSLQHYFGDIVIKSCSNASALKPLTTEGREQGRRDR